MKKPILNICIPTYNRGDVIVSAVKRYLKCSDQRFCISVLDNSSTDNSYELLKKIEDPRFILKQNEINIGGMPNAKKVLIDSINADYIFYSIDKDYIDIEQIPKFIDILERNQYKFGYVDLNHVKSDIVECFSEGKDAVLNLAYKSTHPTGFFWDKKVFDEEVNQSYFKELPVLFDYWFDLLFAHCAVKHQGVIVYEPILLHYLQNPYYVPTISQSYNEKNFYFALPKILETFELYLKDLFTLQLSTTNKREIAVNLLNNTVMLASFALKNRMRSLDSCKHYNMRPRVVTRREMLSNSFNVMKTYWYLMSDFTGKFAASIDVLRAMLYWIIRILAPVLIKKVIRKIRNFIYRH